MVVREGQFKGKQGWLAFAYLVIERVRHVQKDELVNLIWPGEVANSWEVALSVLLSRIKRLMSSGPFASLGTSLIGGTGLYQIILPVDTWIDFEAGVSAIDRAEAALKAGDFQRILGPATMAVSIARRPFLSGIENEWVEFQRRKLERQLLRALECLSHMWLAMGDPVLALETAIESVERDSFRESGHRLLMQSYAAMGNRAKAIEAYHRLRSILEKELGTQPSAETEAAYIRLIS